MIDQCPSDLFADTVPELAQLQLPDATIRFQHGFYPAEFCRDTMQSLQRDTSWRHEQITLFGKRYWQPRLVAAHGDAGTSYTYSGLTLPMQRWTPLLLQIKRDIECISARTFNSVLLNFYRDHHDSMGWHSDDETELGPAPVIASLSFGATRAFRLRHKSRRDLKIVTLDLTEGSLLLMEGSTQKFWKHAVEKSRADTGARINLTFRSTGAFSQANKRQRTQSRGPLVL